MPRPSTRRATAVDWHYYLLWNTQPWKLDKTLLSKNRTETEKEQIINMIPTSAAEEYIQMCELESKLEDAGHNYLAQLLRWKMASALKEDVQKKHRQWAQRAVVMDIEGRWIIQREAYLQDEAQTLSKSLMLSDDKEQSYEKLQASKKELDHLNTQYWKHIRLHGELEGNMPQGIFTRAFQQCHKDPYWYLNRHLREDCARHGGCCGRDCGCCEKDRGNKQSLWRRGHCTSACSCCVYTQKSQGDMTMKKDIEDFPFDIVALNTPYSLTVYCAYIWGIGVDKNP